jgi:hypothetical protein
MSAQARSMVRRAMIPRKTCAHVGVGKMAISQAYRGGRQLKIDPVGYPAARISRPAAS